ncbi:MAG: hypothetical protein IKS69_00460, partial [Erysipelotrichaceae bacterium]|nr:hypothetical protein [Erysipelotrichaceae bacterium]
MKTIRNTALILLSLFLGLFNVVKVMAQEEESFRVTYEFVLQKTEEALPTEIEALLPDPVEGLRVGDIVWNDSAFDDQRIEGSVYHFMGWDPEELVIEDHDVCCVGSWIRFEDAEQNQTESEDLSIKVLEETASVMQEPLTKSGQVTYRTNRWDDFGAVTKSVYSDGSLSTETTDSDQTPEADSDFYEKIALVYGEDALKYMHIGEDTVFVPDEAWLDYGSEGDAARSIEALRATGERHKTSRWDDFPGTGYFDSNTSIRYYPGIYLVGPTDASYSEREKFEVSFCVQPRAFSFGVGTSVPYETVSMTDYGMLSDATKLKIARICTQFVRNIGGNTSAALRTVGNGRSVNQKIGEALAVQSVIW